MEKPRKPVAIGNRFLIALLLTALAWCGRYLLHPYLGGHQPFATFYVAVALVCWWAGVAPAILTATLGFFLGWFFFIFPHPTGLSMAGQIVRILSYVFVCGTIIGLFRHAMNKSRESQGSEQRFKLMSRSVSDALWEWDFEKNSLWWSQGVETVFGYDPVKVGANPEWWSKRIHPEDRARVLKGIHGVIDGKEDHWTDRYRFARVDGTFAFVMDRGTVVRDPSGKPLRMLGGMTDLTAWKETELERQKFKFFSEHASDAHLLLKEDGAIVYANRLACERLGYSEEELLKLTIMEIDPLYPKSRFDALFAQARAGRVEPFEGLHRRKDGITYPVEVTVTAKQFQGQWLMFAASRDVTERVATESALRNSEERFRIIFNQQFQFMALLSPEGMVVEINDLPLRIGGVSREEVVGKLFWETTWWKSLPEMQQNWPKRLAKAAEGNHPVLSEDPYCGADGSIRLAQAAITPIRNAGGALEFFIVQANDVTEQKRAEESLRQVQQQLQLSIEASDLGTWDWNILTDQLIWSPRCRELFGVSMSEEMTFARFLEALHPDDRGPTQAKVSAALGEHLDYEMEFRSVSGGAVRWLLSKGRPFYDEEGRATRLIGTVADITARKRAEEGLRESEARLRAILDTAIEGIITIDAVGNIEQMNPAAERIFEYSSSELKGQNVRILMPSPDRERHDTYLKNFHMTGDRKIIGSGREVIGRRKNGSLFPMDLSVSEVRLPDRVMFSGFIRDISERKRAEQTIRHAQEELARVNQELERKVDERTAKLREAVSELEHFSYTITHDMRSPLRAMRGLAEILLEDASPTLRPEHKNYLNRIMGAAGRMDNLIRDALNYSKVVRENFVLVPIDTHSLLLEMIDLYPNFKMPEAEIEIVRELPRVLANEAGLTQCFSNLLNNAVKFVQPGQVPHVRIWAEERGEHVRIWFEDNGIGIPPEFHSRIFEMFERLNVTYQGTGIGLALVKKVVERMGGRVGVESTPGNGSRFWVELKNGVGCKTHTTVSASAVSGR